MKNKYKVAVISQEKYPLHPRHEEENLGHIACAHEKYSLEDRGWQIDQHACNDTEECLFDLIQANLPDVASSLKCRE